MSQTSIPKPFLKTIPLVLAATCPSHHSWWCLSSFFPITSGSCPKICNSPLLETSSILRLITVVKSLDHNQHHCGGLRQQQRRLASWIWLNSFTIPIPFVGKSDSKVTPNSSVFSSFAPRISRCSFPWYSSEVIFPLPNAGKRQFLSRKPSCPPKPNQDYKTNQQSSLDNASRHCLWTLARPEPWCIIPGVYFSSWHYRGAQKVRDKDNTVLNNTGKQTKALSPLDLSLSFKCTRSGLILITDS